MPASVSASMTSRPGPQTAIERRNAPAPRAFDCVSAFIARLPQSPPGREAERRKRRPRANTRHVGRALRGPRLSGGDGQSQLPQGVDQAPLRMQSVRGGRVVQKPQLNPPVVWPPRPWPMPDRIDRPAAPWGSDRNNRECRCFSSRRSSRPAGRRDRRSGSSSSRLAALVAAGCFAFAACDRGLFSGSDDMPSADACVHAARLKHAIVKTRRFIAAPSMLAPATPLYQLLIIVIARATPICAPRSLFGGRPLRRGPVIINWTPSSPSSIRACPGWPLRLIVARLRASLVRTYSALRSPALSSLKVQRVWRRRRLALPTSLASVSQSTRPSFMMTRKFLSGSAMSLRLAVGSPSTTMRSASAPASITPSLPG